MKSEEIISNNSDSAAGAEAVNKEGVQTKDTALEEYLDIVRKEYDIEREKRQGYENRIGIILTFLGVACFFYFQYIPPKEIIGLFIQEMTFLILIKIIAGIFMYVSMMIGMVASVIILSTKQQKAFAVEYVNEEMIVEPRLETLKKQILAYAEIAKSRREDNNKRASIYKWILFSVIIMLVSTFVYMLI